MDETENDIKKLKIVDHDKSVYKVTNNTYDVSTITDVLYYLAYLIVIIININRGSNNLPRFIFYIVLGLRKSDNLLATAV